MRNVVLRAALLSLVLLLVGSGPASAHASLVGSDPKDGATLRTAPSGITFTFNENVGNPAYISVTAPNGSKVDVTRVRAVDNRVTGTVADVDQKGRYTASYRVVSADGHPVEGTIHYSATTGRTVKQVEPPNEETFIHRHSAHLFWGILAAAVAIALLLAPLRRRDDTRNP
ncbi:copper resistance CopC family protein [Aeromicrobium ginsengisoli]|uniref:copper resistance CopC family protein n=1 Tax=Aeromicrobium ginsengisoli TaxID=363867 RepID=UPI00165EEA80|nr:copper resistance CopC family protein [Aeromicrobium ginsengisoli]